MDKRIELDIELYHFCKILTLVLACYSYCEYMQNPESHDEKEILNTSEDLKFFRIITWRSFINELSKLLLDTADGQNLPKLLRKLLPNGYFKFFEMSEETVIELQAKLESNEELIGRLSILRNKLIAHTQIDYNQPELPIYDFDAMNFTYVEAFDLIKTCYEIVDKIYFTIFNVESDCGRMNNIFYKSRFQNFLKYVAAGKKEQIKNTMDQFLSKKNQ